ncbi:hypothetical protein V6N13_126802 [Hibiscus sabdariffa]
MGADRALSRLNGFVLYENRIRVTYAKFKSRSSYWRKVIPGRNSGANGYGKNLARNNTKGKSEPSGREKTVELVPEKTEEKGESSNSSRKRLKRIMGHVEEESLWKLNRCLIGTMGSVCSIQQVHDRLRSWDISEFQIKRISGRMFLIEIIDDELHKILEEQDWSILKEVFVEVSPWSKNFKVSERSTWVAVSGISFQCWNHTNFKRITEVWGRLEAADENAALCKTGDKDLPDIG